ncbi:MAG: hypothetical protein NTY75_01365 [Candidatus Shapirobacteria bacterium]|nr:hypothetical protein [Candidatus Shapirobacteria bacterium]
MVNQRTPEAEKRYQTERLKQVEGIRHRLILGYVEKKGTRMNLNQQHTIKLLNQLESLGGLAPNTPLVRQVVFNWDKIAAYNAGNYTFMGRRDWEQVIE